MEENQSESNIGQEQNKMAKGGMSQLSPEEARQKARDAVGKGVALGAGAIEGYVDNLEPQVVGKAARMTGQTIRNTLDAVKEELPERKPSVSELGGLGGTSLGSMSGEEGGGLKERIGEQAGAMRERLSERASTVKDAAATKAQELRQRSKAGFAHVREEMKEHTADEIRAKARDTVGRQVARATGALEGVTEQADPDLPANAIHKTGEVVREASSAIKEELKGDKSSSSSSSSSTDTSSGGI